MSAYLARLKQLEDEKNSHNVPDSEPSKPPKVPFDPFGGTHPAHIEKYLTDEVVLRELVLEVMVLVNEPPAEWQGYIDAALADPVDAITCYTALKHESLQPQPTELSGSVSRYEFA